MIPLEDDVQEIIGDVWILLLLVLYEHVLQLVERFSETFDYAVGQEAVLSCVVLLVQWVEYHEVRLGGAVLVERSVKRYVRKGAGGGTYPLLQTSMPNNDTLK